MMIAFARHCTQFFCFGFLLTVLPCMARAQQAVKIDYSVFDRLTRAYVSDQGLVNYRGLRQELAALKSFVDQLAAVSPDSHPQLFTDELDKLRYFATAYNAWVLYHVTAKYPQKDVLWGRFGGIGPKLKFRDQPITLGGQASSLETLEHKILRPRFGDPRIHFYINCAAFSCPPLPQGAIAEGRTDEELNRAARRFINSQKYVRFDPATRRLELSSIFKWFADDFTGWLKNKRGSGQPHIAQYVLIYLDEPTRSALAKIPFDQLRISYLSYDTSLNEQR
jgi:hypothetical protein